MIQNAPSLTKDNRLKIVFLAPFGIRPKGTLIARMLPLAVALQTAGHSVTIIAPPYTNPEDSGRTETVQGVRLVNVSLGPGGKALSAIPVAWRMFRAAVAEKPDLVHLFKPKGYGGIAAMLMIALKQAGIKMPPVFLDTDDWEGSGGMNALHNYSQLEKRVYAFQEQWLLRHAKGVTVASIALEQLVTKMGTGMDNLLYLPNCVTDRPAGDGTKGRQKLGIGLDVPVLLLYTRFFEFSQDRLHRLLADICRQLPQTRFLIVGAGRNNEEKQLQQAAESMGFADALTMAGWTEPKELPDLLAAADMAIYPFDNTLTNRTKCPAKLTELLCSGIPVTADRVGQIPEYLAPELHPFLCDPEDVKSMANHCVKLLQNRDKCRELGRVGREYILEHFRWDDYAAKLERFYRKIEHGKGGLD